jgi:hypothetical protein
MEIAAIKTAPSAATQGLKALQAPLSRHIASHLGLPDSIRRATAALRSLASTDALEQPVLDVRNQTDNHRPRRTERRVGAREPGAGLITESDVEPRRPCGRDAGWGAAQRGTGRSGGTRGSVSLGAVGPGGPVGGQLAIANIPPSRPTLPPAGGVTGVGW